MGNDGATENTAASKLLADISAQAQDVLSCSSVPRSWLTLISSSRLLSVIHSQLAETSKSSLAVTSSSEEDT
jgi:hypothetical protein